MTGDGTSALLLSAAEYDVYNSEELAAELAALHAGAPAIDMRNVRYIDSTCLGELVRAHKRLAASDGSVRIRLLNVGDNVRHVIEITGLEALFELDYAESR